MLMKYFVRALLRDRSLLWWTVVLTLFWLIIGAYAFSFNSGSRSESMKYAATWFSLIGLIIGSTVAVSVANSIYYASTSLSYNFRFSRLTPIKYLSNLMGGSSITNVLFGAFGITATVVIFSSRTAYLVTPASPEIALFAIALMALFMFLLSAVLVVLVNNYIGLKSNAVVQAVPQLLAYAFGLSQFSVPVPGLITYLSPFSDVLTLLYQSYSGLPFRTVSFSGASVPVDPYVSVMVLLGWIGVFFIISVILIRRIRPVNIEEGRRL